MAPTSWSRSRVKSAWPTIRRVRRIISSAIFKGEGVVMRWFLASLVPNRPGGGWGRGGRGVCRRLRHGFSSLTAFKMKETLNCFDGRIRFRQL
jgi:hypothetical protein